MKKFSPGITKILHSLQTCRVFARLDYKDNNGCHEKRDSVDSDRCRHFQLLKGVRDVLRPVAWQGSCEYRGFEVASRHSSQQSSLGDLSPN